MNCHYWTWKGQTWRSSKAIWLQRFDEKVAAGPATAYVRAVLRQEMCGSISVTSQESHMGLPQLKKWTKPNMGMGQYL